MILFEASTTNYDDDIVRVKRALSHIETQCGAPNTYALGQPISRFGWTFFQIAMKPMLVDCIERKFEDMIQKYREGKPEERLTRFLSDFLESRDCGVRLKLV